MRFINATKQPIKVRTGTFDRPGGCIWRTVRHGEIIELPESQGMASGLTPTEILPEEEVLLPADTEEPEAGPEAEPETEPVPEAGKKKGAYENLLRAIPGIGPKTAEDIMNVFSTLKSLRRACKSKKRLPFRDDINILLRRKFGR